MTFPNVYSGDIVANSYQLAKEAIDYAVAQHQRRTKQANFTVLYNHFNRIVNKNAIRYLTTTYGKTSRTKYIDYGISRSKIGLLCGEFLKIPLNSTVSTLSRETISEKLERAASYVGFMASKPYVETVREQQKLPVFSGMQIPDIGDEENWKNINVKHEHEQVMQMILNKKLAQEDIKTKLYDNLLDMLIVSECHTKIEQDQYGRDTVRYISPRYKMFEEMLSDPYCKRSPYHGEERRMFLHEILKEWGDELKTQGKVKDVEDMCYSPGNYFDNSTYDNFGSEYAIPVYTMQFLTLKLKTFKSTVSEPETEPIIREVMDYDKKQKDYEREVEKGKFKLIKKYKQAWFTITRIGKDVYVQKEFIPNSIQKRYGGDKALSESDYSSLLFGTVDGTRISPFEMCVELDITYNIIRFQINRELSKIKGKVVNYDRAYLPKGKNMRDIWHEMTEESTMSYNSAEDGNEGQQTAERKQPFEVLDLGPSSAFNVLITLGQEIEKLIDKITGINDNREGITRASETATGMNQSVEASRTITYPIFYFFSKFVENTLTKLLEKTKTNKDYIENEIRGFLLSPKQSVSIVDYNKFALDEYGAFINDGRREESLRNILRGLYESQINAKELHVQDIARAEMQDTFMGYYMMLEKSWQTITETAQKQTEAQQKSQENQTQEMIQSQEKQQQAKNEFTIYLENLRGDIKKEIAMIMKGMEHESAMQQKKIDADTERRKLESQTE